MDIRGLVETLIQSNGFQQIINNPLQAMGIPPRRYLYAELLPEKQVPLNSYTEDAVQWRTIIANDGTKYSPVQIKGGVLTGSLKVELGYQDIGSEIHGPDYDAILRLIRQTEGQQGQPGPGVAVPADEQALGLMTDWTNRTLIMPFHELEEYQRGQAICNAQIVRVGDDGYTETVNLPNPAGRRVNAAGTWSSNSYDPYSGDIMPAVETLAGIGYTVNRIITGTDVRSKLTLNAKMLGRVARVNVINNAVGAQTPGRLQLGQINALFGEDGLPPIELHDAQYRTSTGSGYFHPRGTMVLVATTGRDQTIDRGDLEPLILSNTLGYTAIGTPAGQSTPGRAVVMTPDNRKPPRVEGQAWQASLPVITQPEAIFVIKNIT